MDSFNSEASFDNHLCIRCKKMIRGLDNYVEHRKRNDCPIMTANQYFSCLELQCKYKNAEEEYDNRSVGSDQSQQILPDNNYDDHSDDEEDETDIYRPPKNFTGIVFH